MLDDFKELAGSKVPSSTTKLMRDSAVTQLFVGEQESRLRQARAWLLEVMRETWDVVQNTGALSLDLKMMIRLASTSAIHRAREVAEACYREAGTTAIFERNHQLPFDSEGRIMLPPALAEAVGITDLATFVGAGSLFYIWQPKAYDDYDSVKEGAGNYAAGNVVTGVDGVLLGQDANGAPLDGTADNPGQDKPYTISKLTHDGHSYTLSADGATVLHHHARHVGVGDHLALAVLDGAHERRRQLARAADRAAEPVGLHEAREHEEAYTGALLSGARQLLADQSGELRP